MKKKLFSLLLCLALILSVGVVAYAAAGGFTMTYLPGTSDTVTNMPAEGYVEAGETYTVSSTIPQREGYEFIDWILDYSGIYKVTYVVNPDKTYGLPEGSVVPDDPNEYTKKDYVKVAAQLTTEKDYAYNENHEKVLGTWEFVTWDKADFEIDADTTVTGGWVFTPTLVKYHYTVNYLLYDDGNGTKVHAPTKGEVDPFTEVHIDAIAPNKLNGQYKTKVQIDPNYQHVDVIITHDDFVINIWYQIKGGKG